MHVDRDVPSLNVSPLYDRRASEGVVPPDYQRDDRAALNRRVFTLCCLVLLSQNPDTKNLVSGFFKQSPT